MKSKRFVVAAVTGMLLGGVLAFVTPAPDLVASRPCRCDDDAMGNYQCNSSQTQCIAGSEYCVVWCTN